MKIKRVLWMLMLLTVLTACDGKLFSPGEAPSNLKAYERLFDDTVEKSFTIEISKKEFDKLDQYMINHYERFGNYKTDDLVEAKMIYEDKQGKIEVDNIAFRTRGNTSRNRLVNAEGELNPLSFKIFFDKALYAEPGSPLAKSIRKREVFDMNELSFKFNKNWDSTHITEKFSYDLFREYGVYAPRMTHAKLYLKIEEDTHFLGLYSVLESIDKSFLKKRLPNEYQGNLYKVLWQNYGPATLEYGYNSMAIGIKWPSANYFPSYDLKTNKDLEDHSELIKFIRQINSLEGAEFKSYLDQNFDVDRLIKLLAIGVLLGNPDDYRAMGNNYYLYYNPVNLKWTMMPYDYDHGMGQGWDGAPVFTNWSIGMDIYTWGDLSSVLQGTPVSHVLTDKLFLNPVYQLKYELYLQDLIESNRFSEEAYSTKYELLKSLYEDDISQSMWPYYFSPRNVFTYIQDKRLDILAQLDYYRNNPSERP